MGRHEPPETVLLTTDVVCGCISPCTAEWIAYALGRIRRLEHISMATQADVDALVAELNSAVSRIQAEISDLQNAHPALDLSALKAAVDGVDAVVPAPVAPPDGTDPNAPAA